MKTLDDYLDHVELMEDPELRAITESETDPYCRGYNDGVRQTGLGLLRLIRGETR